MLTHAVQRVADTLKHKPGLLLPDLEHLVEPHDMGTVELGIHGAYVVGGETVTPVPQCHLRNCGKIHVGLCATKYLLIQDYTKQHGFPHLTVFFSLTSASSLFSSVVKSGRESCLL